MRIVANLGSDKVVDHLTAERWDIAAARVSLFGLEQVPGKIARLLLNSGHQWHIALAGSEQERVARNRLRLRGTARQIERRFEGSELRAAGVRLGQSAILSADPEHPIAFVGQCAPTLAEVGLAPQEATGFVMESETPDERDQFARWFEDQWRVANAEGEVSTFVETLKRFAARQTTSNVYTH